MTNQDSLALESLALAVHEQKEVIKNLTQSVQTLTNPQMPYWIDLKTAASLKGVGTSGTLLRKPWQQPCCGTHFKRANGHRVWTQEQILEWLTITDDTLEAYAEKYQVDISKYFRHGKTLNIYGEN